MANILEPIKNTKN